MKVMKKPKMYNKHNILITGASKGIGLETAKYLNKNHNIYIVSRNTEKLKELKEKYNFKGYCGVDLTNPESVEKLYKELTPEIDVIINNAGVYYYKQIENYTEEEILNTIRLNNIAPIKIIKKYVPYMKEKKWGRIINIGSISGAVGEANASIYSMTKSGLMGLTKSLALELASFGITVNTINPGWVDTELIENENLEEDFTKEEILQTIPQRRFVSPEEIASACEYLISENARTLTGQSINICAGLSIGC